MNRYAIYRVADGYVNSFCCGFIAPDLTSSPAIAAALCQDGFTPQPKTRYTWNGSSVVAYAPSLADNKRDKRIAAAAHFASLFVLPCSFAYSGVLYQIDSARSQSRIVAKGAQALAAIAGVAGSPPWDPAFYWIAADNSHVAMSAAQMYAFAMAVDSYCTNCVLRFRAIKDSIAAAPDQPTLDAIDVTAGYPTASG